MLVIVLGQYHSAKRLQEYFAEHLQNQGINFFVPGAKRANVVNPKYPDNDPNSFWFDNAVTISPVHQAKGNEADVVYILGLDQLSRHEADSAYRNQLFVALTRSRGFAHVSGTGESQLFAELRDVMRMGETLTFTFQRPPKRFISDE